MVRTQDISISVSGRRSIVEVSAVIRLGALVAVNDVR